MTIWSSKKATALGLVSLLGACDGPLETSSGFLSALSPAQDAALPPVPLTQASMMRGQIALVPPGGYCIDPESLTQSFALMGRCDSLGAATGGSGAPVGVLTVSIARNAKDTPLPDAAQIAEAANVTTPQDTRKTSDSIIFKTAGTPPGPELSSLHWRAVAMIDNFIIGAALFGPEGQRAVSSEGASVLAQMLERTAAKTSAR
ncbi:MAG: hypothetical protein ABJP06_03735 [Sulfitobacter sp.]